MSSPSKKALAVIGVLAVCAAVAFGFFGRDIPRNQECRLKGTVVSVSHPEEGTTNFGFSIKSGNYDDPVVYLSFTLDRDAAVQTSDGQEGDVYTLKEGQEVSVLCTVFSSDPMNPEKMPALIKASSVTIEE